MYNALTEEMSWHALICKWGVISIGSIYTFTCWAELFPSPWCQDAVTLWLFLPLLCETESEDSSRVQSHTHIQTRTHIKLSHECNTGTLIRTYNHNYTLSWTEQERERRSPSNVGVSGQRKKTPLALAWGFKHPLSVSFRREFSTLCGSLIEWLFKTSHTGHFITLNESIRTRGKRSVCEEISLTHPHI